MVEQNNRVTKIDAAQYHMLLAMNEAKGMANAPTAQTLVNLSISCRAQKAADREYHVHWSQHLLASLRWKTGCRWSECSHL